MPTQAQAADQPCRIIIRALKTTAPWKPIGATKLRQPCATQLHQTHQGKIELARQGYESRNDAGKTSI